MEMIILYFNKWIHATVGKYCVLCMHATILSKDNSYSPPAVYSAIVIVDQLTRDYCFLPT